MGRRVKWFSKQELCEIFDVSETTLNRVLTHLSYQDKDSSGHAHLFRGRAVVDAFIIHSSGSEDAKAYDAVQIRKYWDALTSRETYKFKRRENRKREGSLIEVSELDPHLQRMATILKGLGRSLHSAFGPEAESLLESAIDEWESILDTIKDSPDGDEEQQDESFASISAQSDSIESIVRSSGLSPPVNDQEVPDSSDEDELE
jgi:hypothetical protein